MIASPNALATPLPEPTGVSLRDVIQLLWRRKRWLILGLLVGLVFGAVVAKLRPPLYEADGLLVIEASQFTIPELQSISSARTAEPWGGRSEARILTSRETIALAVDRLGLLADPDFNSTLRDPWYVEVIDDLDLDPRITERLPEKLLTRSPDFSPKRRARVIKKVKSHLDAASEERSYAITLRYEHEDPQTSAAVVNAVMEAYVARERDARRDSIGNARDQLKGRLSELENELLAAQNALRDAEARGDLVETDDGTVASQRFSSLVREEQDLRVERERIDLDLGQVESALASGEYTLIASRLLTPRLERLWEEEASLQRRLGEARKDFGPRHPVIINLRNETADVRAQIGRELQSIAATLQSERQLNESRAGRLRDLVATARDDAGNIAKGRADLFLKRAKIESTQRLVDLYRERYEQLLLSPDLAQPDARIVSAAQAPLSEEGPGTDVLAGAGGMIGLLAMTAALVGRRWLSDSVRTPDDITNLTHLPVLAVLPTARRAHANPVEAVARAGEGRYYEILRGFLAVLRGPEQTRDIKVVLVSSPMVADGKTSLCLSAARVAAREGLRCLVIEGDYRRPVLADALGVYGHTSPGQDAYRKLHLPFIAFQDTASGAHVLAAREMRRAVPTLLRSSRLETLFKEARGHYDLVFIDTPSLAASSDALLLARHADASLLVCAEGATTRARLHGAVSRLAAAGSDVLGVVLNKVADGVPETHAVADVVVPDRPRRRSQIALIRPERERRPALTG